MLVQRLERLSADSVWAHQASGLRGALLRSISQLEAAAPGYSLPEIDALIDEGFDLLAQAAREIPDMEA